MIYFMQPVGGGPVKIGYSADVHARHRQLEAHYGQPLAILATMEGDEATEREIHDRFAHMRLKGTARRGRWPEQFRPEAELAEFVGRPDLASSEAETIAALKGPATCRIRVSDAYAEWLAEAAKHDRATIAAFLDRSAADRAKEIGFDKPPPERIP